MKTSYITGFHSIEERVNSAYKSIQNSQNTKTKPDFGNYKIFFSKPGPRIKKILETSKKAGISSEQVSDAVLDSYVSSLPQALQDHRGIVLSITGETKNSNIIDFDSWIKTVPEKTTVVILDKVTDPHNVGAILRSCDQFGADLVVLPSHNSACDIEGNEVIGRTSAGASAWIPVAIVNNLVRTVELLKENGFWIYGADAGGQSCNSITFEKKTAIIMGSEGTGISQLLEKSCDQIVSIPTCGKIDSLNVSVAAGILLYELFRRQN